MFGLIKKFIKKIPVLGKIAVSLNGAIKNFWVEKKFKSGEYWERRYAEGGNSGPGSYSHLSEFKADVINKFVDDNDIELVLEFGCGDGNQLKLANYKKYIGFDVSKTAIQTCINLFDGDSSKTFRLMNEYSGEKGDLVLSLDVIYHLIEDEVFEAYMKTLFGASKKYVIIYSSNTDDQSITSAIHVKHRKFSSWIENNFPNWRLIQYIQNKYPNNGNYNETSFADFYIYEAISESA